MARDKRSESVGGGGARASPERGWLDWVWSIFVGGIDRECDVQSIRSSLSRFGVIVDIFIPKSAGVGRGFAFVRFKHAREAELVLKSGSEVRIKGSPRLGPETCSTWFWERTVSQRGKGHVGTPIDPRGLRLERIPSPLRRLYLELGRVLFVGESYCFVSFFDEEALSSSVSADFGGRRADRRED